MNSDVLKCVFTFISNIHLQFNLFRPFLLYIAPNDAHRCTPYNGKLGNFCENFGDGMTKGTGVIQDWKPTVYDPSEVKVPYFLPDTPATRADIASQYKTYSRLDQGDVFKPTRLKIVVKTPCKGFVGNLYPHCVC